MTNFTYEACLEAAKTANTDYTKNTAVFRLKQQELARERDALHLAAVEAAVTPEEVRAAMKLCVKVSKAREEAFFKLVALANAIDELRAIRSLSYRSTFDSRRYNDELVTKWAEMSTLEVEAATNHNELWAAHNRCCPPEEIYWYEWEGVPKYVYTGLRPWEVAEEGLTQPYRDCVSLEELGDLEKLYGTSGIMRAAWYEAHGRLYKEKHGHAPKYSQASMF